MGFHDNFGQVGPSGLTLVLSSIPDVESWPCNEATTSVGHSRIGPNVLFIVEGNTDIRFVNGLSSICNLTMVVPRRQYRESDLEQRVAASGCRVRVFQIGGERIAYQLKSFAHTLRIVNRSCKVDVILVQEMSRSALAANLVGRLRKVPVIAYMGISPREYYRCRRERGQIGLAKSVAGDAVIRCLLFINGRLSTRCLAMGRYLSDIARNYCRRTEIGLYYGIDVDQFRPAATARPEMAQQLGLPGNKFLALFSSRISHEKDPETAIRAVAQVRARGLEAILLNIGGGYQDFVNLAKKMKVPDYSDWVIGRPAVHPVTEVFKYYQAANVVVQASLAEGLGLTPLEALACGTPVVATEVGGMALELREFARLVPRQNAEAMADQIDWVANNPCEAEEQALRGRDYIVREWSRTRAFEELRLLLEDVSKTYRPSK